MDKLNRNFADLEKWDEFSLSQQMGNIGAEVSRVIRFKNTPRAKSSFDKALELIDLTVQSLVVKKRFPAVSEMLAHRELLCNYFYKDDTSVTTPDRLEKYYISFYTG